MKKNRLILFLLLFLPLLPLHLQAQAPPRVRLPEPIQAQAPSRPQFQDTVFWKTSYNIGLNFNQSAFSDNWRAGGVSSIALGSLFLGKANHVRHRLTFDNLLDLQYGVVNTRGLGTRKTNDRILFDSKVGRILTDRWNLFTSLNFLTQFARGYDHVVNDVGQDDRRLISNFLAPAFLTSSWGAEFRPREYFQFRISPFSPRITIVTDPNVSPNVPRNYGVPVGKRVRYEWLAAQVFANYDRQIKENLSLKWRYMMFANYDKLLLREIDHRMDLTFNAKITRFLNVSLAGIILYDRDQDVRVQYSQTLGLGLLISRGGN
jgi:hypothetical protein